MTQQRTPEPVALIHAAWLEKSLTIGAPEAAAELRRLHEVEKQRDELLEALEKVTAKLAWLNSDDCGHIMALTDEAEAIIASVKGINSDDCGSRAGYECPVCRQCDCCGCATSDHFPDATKMIETSAPAIVFYPAGSLGEAVETEGGES